MECLPRIHSVIHTGKLVISHGYSIEIYDRTGLKDSIAIFCKNRAHVYGIVSDIGGIFVYGEREMAFVGDSTLLQGAKYPINIHEFDDQIMAVKPLGSHKVGMDLSCLIFRLWVAIMFSCNAVSLYELKHYENLQKLTFCTSVQSAYSCLLLKAILIGDTWENLCAAVGTVFGEILVSSPSAGTGVLRKYIGHTGMIFDMVLANKYLFSISDDRSLRIWKFSTEPSDVPLQEVACEYGHLARPFCICIGHDSTIFTAGIDQTVYQWKYDTEHKLRLVNSFTLGIGCIRSIIYYESRVYCGSENGALISFTPAVSKKVQEIATGCDDLRNFARDHTSLYTVNARGQLFLDNCHIFEGLCTRFLTSSQLHEKTRCVVAFGKTDVVIFQADIQKTITFSMKIFSCVCAPNFVLIYFVNKTAALVEVSSNKKRVVSFVQAIEAIGMKKSLIFSTMSANENRDGVDLIIGSVCGHLFLCKVRSEKNELTAETYLKVNRHFAGEQIFSVKCYPDFFKCLVKNIGTVYFKWNSDLPLWVNTTSASEVSDIDIPSAFVPNDTRFLIGGFHSKEFHLIDENGLSAFRFECGGGSRPWNCFISNDEVIFEFLRRQKIIQVHQPLTRFICHQETVHRSQVVFVHILISTSDNILLCTGSNDTTMVFTLLEKKTNKWKIIRRITEPSGFLCTDSIRSGDELILATGCGKGRIIVWRLDEAEFLNTEGLGLFRKAVFSHDEDIRVLNLKFASDNVLGATLADGSIGIFSISGKLIKPINSIPAPDLSLFTKIDWLVEEKDYFLLGISTSGKLHVWFMDNVQFIHQEEIQVASFGLSSLAVSNEGFIAIGSESGELFSYKREERLLREMQKYAYHSCTITDIKYAGLSYLITTSLDCRLAVYFKHKDIFSFLHAKSLAIWDPSSIVIDDEIVIAVGSGIHTLLVR